MALLVAAPVALGQAQAPVVANAGLRPTRDASFRGLRLDNLVEAQKLRQQLDQVIAEVLKRPALGHDALRDVLGRNYLVRAFDCEASARCLLQHLMPLRSRNVRTVVLGAYFSEGDRYIFTLGRLELSQGERLVEERFALKKSELYSTDAWRPHVARLLGDLVEVAFEPPVEVVEPAALAPDAGVQLLDGGVGPVEVGPGSSATGKSYAGRRTEQPLSIDGLLDEPVWQTAPVAGGFVSLSAKPRGSPTKDPTFFQVAFDESNLYVAIRAEYGAEGERDTGVSLNEWSTLFASENVGVGIDPLDDKQNSFEFHLTRAGFRCDAALADDGRDFNIEWGGIWEGASATNPKGWTAEFRIPWGTLGISAQSAAFKVGLNVFRLWSSPGEMNIWALFPPSKGPAAPPSEFGQLSLDSPISPGQRLLLSPYVAVALHQEPTLEDSRLKDLLGRGGPVTPFVGLFARLRPTSWLNLSLTLNPDFSQVSLNSSESKLSQYPLFLPEVREFFVEKSSLFNFGESDKQLFYSRAIGIQQTPNGFAAAPLLWGAKAIVTGPGFEVGLLDTATTGASGPLALLEHVDVVRGNVNLGESTRVGAMFQSQTTNAGEVFLAYGADARTALFSNHLSLSGFVAQTNESAPGSPGQSGLWGAGRVKWLSEEFALESSYSDVADSFSPRLGFFYLTGARSADIKAMYMPKVMSDEVRTLYFTAYASRTTANPGDSVLIGTRSLTATIESIGGVFLEASYSEEQNGVLAGFDLAAGRLTIAPGQYSSRSIYFGLDTPEQQAVSVQASYLEGTFYDGHRRTPSLSVSAKAGRFYGKLLYELLSVSAGGSSVTGHRVSSQLTYAFGPGLRSILMVDLNSFDAVASSRLVTIWEFSPTNSLSLVVAKSNPDPAAFFGGTGFEAIVKLSLGLTPF